MSIKATDEQKKLLLNKSKFAPDHEGNAQRVLLMFPDMFRFNETHGWFAWTGTHWTREGARQRVENAIVTVLIFTRHLAVDAEDNKIVNRTKGDTREVNGVRQMMSKSPRIFTPIRKFDNKKYLVNCKNGTVNIKTGELLEHNPKHLLTHCLPFEFKESTAQAWFDFLSSVGLSQDIVDYLQTAVGYSLTGFTSEEVLFYIHGPSRSGKGIFTRVIHDLLGNLSGGVNFKTFTANRTGDTSNFDLAPLKGLRFITASEGNRYNQLNPQIIKQITGNDPVYCSLKGKDHFSYIPQFKIWLTSNYKANTDVDDDAAWGRLRIINFPNTYLGKEDKGLKGRMLAKSNMEAVLYWAVQGAVKWYSTKDQGLIQPKEMEAVKQEHRDEQDSVGQFIEDCCVIGDEHRVVGSILYARYKEWGEAEGYKPKGRRQFSVSLSQRGIVSKNARTDGKAQKCYHGISES